jgi:alkaline phosphatase D
MRRLLLVPLALVTSTLLPATASAAFRYGTAAGEITSNSAKVWAHSTRSGIGVVQLDFDRGFLPPVASRVVRARASSDNNLQATFRGLRPGRTYHYRFLMGRSRSVIGRFETAPRPTANATIEFAFSGDADATPKVGTRGPFFNRFQVYRRMMLERNDFNLNFGDTIYSDSNRILGVTPTARTVSQKWGKYRTNLAQPPLAQLRTSTGVYSHIDDHEVLNDFSIPEVGRTIYNAGIKAFRDYAPVTYTSRDGLYRTFRWGRNVELFLPDERSFRSAKASAGGVCNNPQTGTPDEAPTAPQDKRNLFAAIYPPLAQPVSQACKDAINNPNQTFFGQRQFAVLTQAIQRSTATWKIVMTELPVSQIYYRPYDRIEGYAAERQRFLEAIRNVRNLVFLTTDVHAVAIGDVRFQTLEPGGPIDTGFDEVITGPVATRTLGGEIDDVTGNPGSGNLLMAAFFKPAPPDGLGAACVNPDVYSYAQVKVTNTAITITNKDLNGRVVVDSVDRRTPCVLSIQRQ